MPPISRFFARFFARCALFTLWLLHWLPLPLLRVVGRGLGALAYRFAPARRAVARVNLALCFPDRSEAERERLTRTHFTLFAQTLLERGLLWWASQKRLSRLIVFSGAERLDRLAGQPVVLLAPHFIGLDAGGMAILLHGKGVSLYSKQKNPVFDRQFRAGRMRFHGALLFSRQDGIRPILKAMRQGLPFYYLPDMDLGRRNSIFVPFFGVEAATVPALSRIVRATGAKVLPILTRLTPQGYHVEILPPWENFPGESIEDDTRFMNRAIEEWIMAAPEQYYWLHKRFKTRPAGSPSLYPDFIS
ncbi:MAG: lysophospholipid acyltransferase family protein [Zoogloeaceae bacterium]|nr:lysophospholipid acyltransferase family protein [Zoogloeaceae bacterium]